VNRIVPRALGTLVFDGDCSFCSTSARLVRSMVGPSVRVIPFQRADLASLGLTLEQVEEAVWWVGADGRRARGHWAVAAALQASRGLWRSLGTVLNARAVAPAASRAYAWVARNRHRLPGGAPECRPDGPNQPSDLRV
jgi:predicted DCC family thiol-disulfide oxidoreductase YuxK